MGYLRDVSVFVVGPDRKSLKHFIKNVLVLLRKVIKMSLPRILHGQKVYAP